MPSPRPLPKVDDFRLAGARAIKGLSDSYADTRDGSMLDHVSGPFAILMAREVSQDQANFRAITIDDSSGQDLTTQIVGRWQIPRIMDGPGVGTMVWTRPNASGGGGTIFAGTRVAVVNGAQTLEYKVSADTSVAASALSVTLPIVSSLNGVGVACAVSNQSLLRIEDAVFDSRFVAISLTCSDGTAFEDATTYRARARQLRANARNGYIPAMLSACQAAGAKYMIAFASNYGLQSYDFTSDYGLNAVYVANANYVSTPALIQACAVALEGARVLGADLWVGGIQTAALSVSATLYLNDDPSKLPTVPIIRAATQALLAQFSPNGAGYVYKFAAMASAIVDAAPQVHNVAFTAPTTEPSFPANTYPTIQGFPGTLTRYTLSGNAITFALAGPN